MTYKAKTERKTTLTTI